MASHNVPELDRIREALSVSYSARAQNHERKAALEFLDEIKARSESPQYGYYIARETSQPPEIRQFGLSLLEHAVKYNWTRHNEEQAIAIKNWVIALVESLTHTDTTFYRNKLAWLWSQLAKRIWAGPWSDMDRILWTLWDSDQNESQTLAARQFVLDILETLSEDICVRDEPVAMLRQEALGSALNDIMLPRSAYEAQLESRTPTQRQQLRFTDQGWLAIMSRFLHDLVSGQLSSSLAGTADLVSKLLQAIRPTISWINLQAMIDTDCVMALLKTFSVGDDKTQTAAVECLQDLARRPHLEHLHDEWMTFQRPLFQAHAIDLYAQQYSQASIISAKDIDDDKYSLAKKISELLCILGDSSTRISDLRTDSGALQNLNDLLITIYQSESLSISVAALHVLHRILQSGPPQSHTLDFALPVLLGTCSQRLLRYEYLPDTVQPDIVLFLQEDYETLPEQHAFLGNYRRYCNGVVSAISKSRPLEALQHILGETLSLVQKAASLGTATFSKSDIQVLQLQAQHSVVKSALEGFWHWTREVQRRAPQPTQDQQAVMQTVSAELQQWCREIMQVSSPRPDVACLLVQLLVEVGNAVKDINKEFVQALSLWLLDAQVERSRTDAPYKDALKGFLAAWVTEQQRLASAFPDFLFEIYDQLEQKINVLTTQVHQDSRTQWGLRTVLVILCHRASALGEEARLQRLQQMAQGLSTAWQEERLVQGLSSPAAFHDLVGLSGLTSYLADTPFETVQDWSVHPLDARGRSIAATTEECLDRLPLRMTTTLLAATTDRLADSDNLSKITQALWKPLILVILPNLISMLRLATGFASPGNWRDLSQPKQKAIQSMFVDRFWQSGISSESKDDFTARVSRSGETFEGFASTVRGAPRQIRDMCYQIIHRLARFDDGFFSIDELPNPLADAILGQAASLSIHHLQRTINLVERLTMKCPPWRRANFLPPLLSTTFSQLDSKISAEWERIDNARSGNAVSGDDLGDEMQAESVVRTTTHSIVVLINAILDARWQDPPLKSDTEQGVIRQTQIPRHLVLTNLSVLEPLIVLCTHALSMRDSRCCSIIAKCITSCVPDFSPAPRRQTNHNSNPSATSEAAAHNPASMNSTSDTHASPPRPPPQVGEFICSHTLKAAITSLNDPYFVDCQRDLATLIATVLRSFAPHSSVPREILLSLPDMSPSRVDGAIQALCRRPSASTASHSSAAGNAIAPATVPGTQSMGSSHGERMNRAIVLELLENVRGVAISEAGKIRTNSSSVSAPASGFGTVLSADRNGNGSIGGSHKRGNKVWLQNSLHRRGMDMQVENGNEGRTSPGLEGIGEMFGGA